MGLDGTMLPLSKNQFSNGYTYKEAYAEWEEERLEDTHRHTQTNNIFNVASCDP